MTKMTSDKTEYEVVEEERVVTLVALIFVVLTFSRLKYCLTPLQTIQQNYKLF
jgi:hypothetical protein